MNDPMANVPGYRGGGIPFFAAADVTLNAGGTAPPFDSRRLGNPYRQAMVIDEIHFQIKTVATPGGDTQPPAGANMGGSVRARFKLGRVEVSHDFVPIWNYGTLWNDENSESFGFIEGLLAGGGSVISSRLNYYRWILPKPLYIPAGNILQPSISRQQDGLAFPTNVWVGYGCRRLGPHTPPAELDVPYVATFLPGEIAEGSSPNTFQSSENDLVNPFLSDLKVQRFTGRVQSRTATTGVTSAIVDDAGSEVTLVMKDSYGTNIIRDFTSWNHVFDRNRRAWTFNRILKAKERYNVSLANVATGASPTNFYSPMIAMIGTRRERMSNV